LPERLRTDCECAAHIAEGLGMNARAYSVCGGTRKPAAPRRAALTIRRRMSC